MSLEVTKLKRSENANDKIVMGFAVARSRSAARRIRRCATCRPPPSIEQVRSATKGKDAQKVVGGAVLGAIVGQVLGKNTKGTVIGAAAGAAAGPAAAAATANYEGCVNDGGRIVDQADVAAYDQSLTVRE